MGARSAKARATARAVVSSAREAAASASATATALMGTLRMLAIPRVILSCIC